MTVYALSEPDGSLVKIGHAADVRARFRSLMLGSPVPIVLRAHWTGSLATERALHERFADLRRHGEWFKVRRPGSDRGDLGGARPVAPGAYRHGVASTAETTRTPRTRGTEEATDARAPRHCHHPAR